MSILDTLDHFFSTRAPMQAGDGLLVAFSGGPDSTALLETLVRLTPHREWRLVAAHLDHGLDPEGAARAHHAAAVARRLGVGWIAEAVDVTAHRRGGESLEAVGRRLRYAFLERARRQTEARWVVTAHHADDQAETVLLRVLQGTGLEGLVSIRPRRGRVVRPLLAHTRAELASVRTQPAADDPANRDPRIARSAVRHRLLPRLEAARPGLTATLARIAARSAALTEVVHGHLDAAVPEHTTTDGPAIEIDRLKALAPVLRPWVLARLHRRAGARHPAGSEARRELARQLDRSPGKIGCDAGNGWRWHGENRLLVLSRAATTAAGVTERADFTYTLSVPGEVAVPELDLRLRLRSARPAPWMYRGAPDRAGLTLPRGTASRVTIRTRRPGDRLRPLGAGGTRRLKEVLIDHRVPAATRDRVPLLVVDGQVAWVPGVTVDERFRLHDDRPAWIVEILPLNRTESSPRGLG